MLKDEQPIDFFKLFLVVREKGGYDKVSKNGLWDLVAKESGLGLSSSVSVKLVYATYLDALERWLDRVADYKKNLKSNSIDTGSSLSEYLMKLGEDFKSFLSYSNKMDEVYPHLEELDYEDDVNVCRKDVSMVAECKELEKCVNDEETIHIGPEKRYVDAVEVVNISDDSSLDDTDVMNCVLNLSDSGEQCNNEDMKSVLVGKSDGGNNSADSDKDGIVILDLEFVKEKEGSSSRHEKTEDSSCCKRKNESMWKMLSWIAGIAKNP